MAHHSTPYPKDLRIRWYQLVDREKQSVAAVCSLYGIPRKTYYKWRAYDFGIGSHNHHSPQRQPALKLTPEVRILIEQEKQRTNYGPLKMSIWLGQVHGISVSPTAIYRFYRRRGLIRKPQRRLPWYQPLTQRIFPACPGALVEADLKVVWLNGIRHYQFTFYDVWTGIPSVTLRTRKEDDDAMEAFREAQSTFSFPMLCVQTDNGGEFRGDFHRLLVSLGIQHAFIPKRSPWWSGHVERFHGVLDQEYYHNPRRAFESLPDYLAFYVNERIHLGTYLNGCTPMQKLTQSLPDVSPLRVN